MRLNIVFLKHLFFCSGFIVFIFSSNIYAQSTGTAASGGSIAADRITNAGKTVDIPDSVKYRNAIQHLKINDDALIAQYKDARETGKDIKLKSLILAHLIARKINKTDAFTAVDNLIPLWQSGKSFERGIEQAFSLSKAEIRIFKLEAERLLKDAMK